MENKNSDKEYGLNLILDHLLNGQNQDKLNDWLSLSEENKLYYDEVCKTWMISGVIEQEKAYDDEKAYSLFLSRCMKAKSRINRRYFAYAAVMIPFILLSYFSWMYFDQQNKDVNTTISKVLVDKGSKTKLELSDGTKIWLNSDSELQIGETFNEGRRSVKLIGEAYLEVAKKGDSPFFVETANMTVKVLGTKFNVNAYNENDKLSVSLLEGAVEVSAGENQDNKVILKPNEAFRYDNETGKIEVIQDGVSDAVSWMTDGLIFEAETFEQIVYTLTRHFNVDIQITKEVLKKRRFSGDFVKNESLDKIFSVMSSEGDGFSYKKEGEIIQIY